MNGAYRILDLETLTVHPVVAEKYPPSGFDQAYREAQCTINRIWSKRLETIWTAQAAAGFNVGGLQDRRSVVFDRRSGYRGDRRKDAATRARVYPQVQQWLSDPAVTQFTRDDRAGRSDAFVAGVLSEMKYAAEEKKRFRVYTK